MSNQKNFAVAFLKDVHKVIDVAKGKVTKNIQSAAQSLGFCEKGSVDLGLPTYDQLIHQFKQGKNILSGCSYTCLIRPDQVYTDTSYNRAEELSINKVKDNITKYKGFEHKLAGAIQISVRPDGDGEYLFDHPITTKGNHRTLSAWLMNVPLIKADVFFHPVEFTADQCVIEEASIHHGDCTDRSNQVPEQKFVSAVYAGQSDLFQNGSPEKKAVELNNFLNSRGFYVSTKVYGKNVPVAYDLNPLETTNSAKKITSHDSISTARANYGDKVVGEVLSAIMNVSNTNTIPSNFIRAASLFFYVMEEPLKDSKGNLFEYCGQIITPLHFLSKKVQLNSLEIKIDFLNFVLNECKPKITFEKVTADSGKYKGPELYASRLVFLFNQYVQDRMSEGVFKSTVLQNRRVRFLCPNDPHWNYIRSLSNSVVLGSFLDGVMSGGTF